MSVKITRRPNSQAIKASQSITSNVRNRNASAPIMANMNTLTPSQQAFARTLYANAKRSAAITAATNTVNIMAKPDFLSLLPMFVQKLIITDVFGSVAMKSRQQIVPYFKFIAENTKGETKAGDIISSPFVNRLGQDPNFAGRLVKNEVIADSIADATDMAAMYHLSQTKFYYHLIVLCIFLEIQPSNDLVEG